MTNEPFGTTVADNEISVFFKSGWDGMADQRIGTGSPVVVLSLRVRASEEMREDILRSVCSLIGPATAEKACVACRVFQEAGDPNLITFVQAWTSRTQLDRHVRSHQYRNLLSVLDLSHTAPEVRLDNVFPIKRGIEVLAAIAADDSWTAIMNSEGGVI